MREGRGAGVVGPKTPAWRAWRVVWALLCALVALACLASATGCANSGMMAVAKSVFNRVAPVPEQIVYARTPQPDDYSGSYADATGSGANYVYDLDAVTAAGDPLHVQIISFGGKTSGVGFLEIKAKGDSGVYYWAVDEGEIPQEAREALGEV